MILSAPYHGERTTLWYGTNEETGDVVSFRLGQTVYWQRIDRQWTSGTVLGVEGGMLSVRAENGRVLVRPEVVS